MASIPSSGSLVATHDYYRRRIGSTSSNSSCGSSDYTGEVIPHHPGLPRQDSGHWWASFFFGKQSTPIGHDTQHKAGTHIITNDKVTCIAKEMVLQRKLSVSSDQGNPEPSTSPDS
ncbi:pancreatic progenitor cell differentiation and proliferation factor A [Tachysurus ichikawai]